MLYAISYVLFSHFTWVISLQYLAKYGNTKIAYFHSNAILMVWHILTLFQKTPTFFIGPKFLQMLIDFYNIWHTVYWVNMQLCNITNSTIWNLVNDVLFVTYKIKWIAYLYRALIPISRYVNNIKVHQDFPELWSQIYCHVFMGHSVQHLPVTWHLDAVWRITVSALMYKWSEPHLLLYSRLAVVVFSASTLSVDQQEEHPACKNYTKSSHTFIKCVQSFFSFILLYSVWTS